MFSTLRSYSKIVILIIVLVMIISGGLMGYGAYVNNNSTSANVAKPYIARVNDTKISQQDYLSALRSQASQSSQLSDSQVIPFKSSVLESMIEREVILQQADEMGIKSRVTDKDVEDSIKKILDQNKMTKDELESRLKKQGYTLSQLKKDIRTNLDTNSIIQQTVKKSYNNVNVTEKEIKDAYKKSKSKKDYAEVKDQLKSSLLKQKQNTAFQNWLESVKADAKITITDPTLGGYNALMNSNFDKAIKDFNTAIDSNPIPSLYVYLAQAYDNNGDKDKVIETFDKAVKDYPENGQVRLSYGDFFAKSDEKEKAIEQYDQASKIAGDDFMTHYKLYIAYSGLKVSEKAKAEMKILKDIQAKMQKQQEKAKQDQQAAKNSENKSKSTVNKDNKSGE